MRRFSQCSSIMGLWGCYSLGEQEGSWGGRRLERKVWISFHYLSWIFGLTILPRIGENKALSTPVTLGASDSLKILLTTKEDNKAKRPHQTFLLVKDPKSNLDTYFPFQVKENGKGKIELVRFPNTSSSSYSWLKVTDPEGFPIPITIRDRTFRCVPSSCIIRLVETLPLQSFRYNL